MKRPSTLLVLTVLVSLALILAWAVPALAGPDDDIPGTPLALGSTVSQTVGSTDAADVFAVDLTAGQEVHIRCDPGTAGSATGTFHLLVPGVLSLAASHNFEELIYTLRAGSPTRSWADYDYVPAKSGTYYLVVKPDSGTLSYSLSVKRSARAALALATDADDLPGAPVGAGTVVGVVSTFADVADVYSVRLTAGRAVTIRLVPLSPYNNSFSARAYLNLLDPQTPSLNQFSGHVLAGLAEAVNDKNAASRKVAQIQYTPTQDGTYYIWVDAPTAPYGHNFAYQLSISGSADDNVEPPEFSDIQGSPYATAIVELATRGIIGGFTDGTFRPNELVTRQQFAKMIVKALELTVTGGEVCLFTDVDPAQGSDSFYPDKYVAVCAAAGITKGTTATTFKPYDNITRQQLVSMVVRGAVPADPPALYLPPFAEGQFSPNEHYVNARKAAYAGLLDSIEGMGPAFNFFVPATRGECAQLLYNLVSGG
jgi:hypothetical protein